MALRAVWARMGTAGRHDQADDLSEVQESVLEPAANRKTEKMNRGWARLGEARSGEARGRRELCHRLHGIGNFSQTAFVLSGDLLHRHVEQVAIAAHVIT